MALQDRGSCRVPPAPQQAFELSQGKDARSALYPRRWEVETNLRHLKQTLGMDVLRTKTVDGIEKELVMFAIASNLVRLVMLESAGRQGVDPDQISFADSLSWL